jgi:hypothetical protein
MPKCRPWQPPGTHPGQQAVPADREPLTEGVGAVVEPVDGSAELVLVEAGKNLGPGRKRTDQQHDTGEYDGDSC